MDSKIIRIGLYATFILFANHPSVAETSKPEAGTVTRVPALPDGTCPLNSGGPSLLGTEWRLFSIYGNQVPKALEITMKVGETTLEGFGGCNDYTAQFQQVGHTGFMVNKVERGQKRCAIVRPEDGGPTIDIGDWEGAYIRTLQRAGSVKQEGNTLHFFNRSGGESVVFVKKFGSPSTTKENTDAPPNQGSPDKVSNQSVDKPAAQPAEPGVIDRFFSLFGDKSS